MIKKYFQFIKETKDNSFGEWVESHADDDYVKNIINRFIGDVDPKIRIANAINLLDDNDKLDIKNQLDDYLEHGIQEKEPEVSTTVLKNDLMNEQVQDEISLAGKGIFHSFLKSLTALGKKDTKSNLEKCPDDFLIFYYYESLIPDDVKNIFNRFKSLSRYVNMIDHGKAEINLYFGIKNNGRLQYGIFNDNLLPIGEFKLSKSTINWILSLESKSAQHLKKDLVNLSYNDIITLGYIKNDVSSFKPGYYEKKSYPVINDRVISFGWYGFGNWSNGQLNMNDLINVKRDFNKWVISKKWGTKVLISVTPRSFWLWIKIKLK